MRHGLRLRILKQEYFKEYETQLAVDVEAACARLKSKPQSADDFKLYLANSAVHSSNIEGNSVSFDTYLKASEFNLHLRTKEIREIEELIAAYQFARENDLSPYAVLKAHEILTQSILVKSERGKIRTVRVGVRNRGRLIYLAVEPEFIEQELEKLFDDISLLQKSKLTTTEIFYFAAFIHLIFVNIHPFVDGNGRATRLVEKWFLAKMLGENAWCITTEKNYWDNRPDYYRNLQLGVNYYEVKYEKSVPFLLMLPNSLLDTDFARS